MTQEYFRHEANPAGMEPIQSNADDFRICHRTILTVHALVSSQAGFDLAPVFRTF